MDSVYTIIFYMFSFISVYVQVFFLITFLEKRKKIIYHPDNLKLNYYPTVAIAIPCYNEEATISKTVNSLLLLDYPKDKISIFIVDDGSRDNTWNVVQEFKDNPNIILLQKTNGGKHTAVNLALEKTDAEFFGCLDSDSFVHPEALKRILKYFENDPRNMAIASSVIVYDPKTIIQQAQSVEYDMSIYTKKMLGFLGGINVTPGPFSIFRKKVFDELGPYRKAHNTEDQEIALRMQEYGYKIDHCPDAYIYTNTPNSVSKLYRQRLRWVYGFIRNLVDYKHLLFRKKYGTVALFTLPTGLISIFGVMFLFITIIGNIIRFIYKKIIQIKTIGFSNFFNSDYSFDWFFINTKAVLFLSVILYILIIISVTIGRRMSEGKSKFSISILYFFIIYSVIAPFWMLKAIYNAIRSKESSWTFERRAKTQG